MRTHVYTDKDPTFSDYHGSFARHNGYDLMLRAWSFRIPIGYLDLHHFYCLRTSRGSHIADPLLEDTAFLKFSKTLGRITSTCNDLVASIATRLLTTYDMTFRSTHDSAQPSREGGGMITNLLSNWAVGGKV